jgi:uncharacterized membrane protein YedE/YeeE
MIRSLSILATGIMFGAGLALSGMLNPSKVAGFLDLFGVWDPSLAFVMGGGVVLNFIGHRFVIGRGQPIYAQKFSLPTRGDLDPMLIWGSALFGVGWALAGLCPGPAIASVLLNPEDGVLFLVLMMAGLYIGRRLQAQTQAAATQ